MTATLTNEPPTDWSLVERVQAGDDRAFDELMARHKRAVLNFIFRMIRDASEAEDLAQDVFVRAYRHIRKGGFGPAKGASFTTWLFQVARNAALDCLRRRKRHPAESLQVLDDRGEFVPAAGRTADQDAAAHDIGEAIAAAVALLPEDQRTALVLSEYQGLPHSEIAAIMKCSEKAVESRLYRARQFLRTRLGSIL